MNSSICASSRPVGDGVIPLVGRLRDALDAQGVVYCHWKSNWKLDRWIRGEGDLDLLVARADAQRFTNILSELGFKQAVTPRDREVPGIVSYYGFDTAANRFVHVHAHYQLVLGHDLTKNYHVPIEAPFLESAVRNRALPVPSPEFELLIFVLRMVLKYSVFESMLGKPITPSRAVQTELSSLEAQADRTRLWTLLEQHLPAVDPLFFFQCVESLRPGCPGWKRLAVRLQLEHRLRAFSRRPQSTDVLRRLGRRASRMILGPILRRSSRKRLARGGAIIALVGGDGAGKTTSLNEIYGWLRKKFDTRRVHIGKPPRSLLTLGVIVALRATRGLDRRLHGKARPGSVGGGGAATFPGYLQLFRWVLAARDRYRLYIQARRFATNGGLVICDRYPVPQIQLMEGPSIGRTLGAMRMNRLVRFLLQTESWYYQQIMPPDLLIVLRVDPEIAVQRKTNEDPEHVRARSQELWEVDWRGTRAHVIDTSRPREEVASDLKSLVWSQL